MESSFRSYSLRKSRHILQTCYDWYKRHWQALSPSELKEIEYEMERLDQAVVKGDRSGADPYAKRVEGFYHSHYKKSIWTYAWEIILAIIFALAIATLIRQTWFELYEIPTGSMRPTFQEQDRLIVTKTAFGINMPLETEHIYFDPDLVQRTSVFIFSADQMPVYEPDTTYFGLFPYKKRLIKRCMGKPGDTLYFYGGKIYGMDREGHLITELIDSPWMNHLEYLPFMSFEEATAIAPGQLLYKLFDQPAGRLTFKSNGELVGEVFDGNEWVKDRPRAAKGEHAQIETYSDLYGLRNFAMARLLNKQQIQELYPNEVAKLEEGKLYLELRHSPSFSYPKPSLIEEGGGVGVLLTPQISLLPLQDQHLDQLMQAMYTARFEVKNGRARRYNVTPLPYGSYNPRLANVPDGTYEFYYGKAYQISWGGISSQVPDNFALYSHDPANVQLLFNLGIDLNTALEPHAAVQRYLPHRYAYFREGDLFVMGAPILQAKDPALVTFLKREEERAQQSKGTQTYLPFKDYGAPMKNGQIDTDFMQTFGLKIPEGHYLALGDNHAMSGDSRVFGFVPAANLQGAPSFILWPPGPRWGVPLQKPYPWITVSNMIIWGLAALIIVGWLIYRSLGRKKFIYYKLSPTSKSAVD